MKEEPTSFCKHAYVTSHLPLPLQSYCDHIFFFFFKVGIDFWLYQVLVAACGNIFFFFFSYGM